MSARDVVRALDRQGEAAVYAAALAVGRYLTPAELEEERAAIGDFGLTVVAAWMANDEGRTVRYSRATSAPCEKDAR